MRNINIFASLLAMSALVSCNLDVISKDSISPDTYFSKESELRLYTNQFYSLEPEAEDLYAEPSNLIVSGNTLPAVMVGVTRKVPSSGGGWSWSSLRHINYFLANSNRCTDAAARDHYNGVALFFRAYFYFDKVVRFGDVPWYSEPLFSDDEAKLKKPQDGRDVVVENIIKDLDRTATCIKSSGLYTGAEKEMLFLVVSYKEVAGVKLKIKEADPRAFVVVTDAYDAFGEGWKQLPSSVNELQPE